MLPSCIQKQNSTERNQLIDCYGVCRFPSWSFEDWAQFELDTLEDIFKRSDGWQERSLKPALSSILAPALCAVYGKLSSFWVRRPSEKWILHFVKWNLPENVTGFKRTDYQLKVRYSDMVKEVTTYQQKMSVGGTSIGILSEGGKEISTPSKERTRKNRCNYHAYFYPYNTNACCSFLAPRKKINRMFNS